MRKSMFLEEADCDGLIRYLGAHVLIPEVNRAQDQRGYTCYVWGKRYGEMAVVEILLRRAGFGHSAAFPHEVKSHRET